MTDTTQPVNQLILGDNLEIMKTLEKESVDLIYLDPPFLPCGLLVLTYTLQIVIFPFVS